MIKSKLIRLTVILLLLFGVSYAQELSFENVQLKGLPSTEVYKVLQDADGFMWFATDAGVCKYDGNTLTTYTAADGLRENPVIKMKLDSKKRIWFVTPSGYFFYYDKGHFTQLAANNAFKKICIYPILDFMIGEKDTLFITGLNTGKQIVKVPPEDNYNKIIATNIYSEGNNIGRFILKNKANPSELISLGSFHFTMQDSTYKVQVFDTIVIASLKNIKEDYSSSVNSSTVLGPDGTVYFVSRNKLTYIKDRKIINYYNFSADILKIYFDADGDLWIGVKGNGIHFFKHADLTKPPIHSMDSLSVSSIVQDKEGSVWATTLEKGIFQCMNKYVYSIPGKVRNFKVVNNQLNIGFISPKELLVSTTDSIRYLNEMKLLPKNSEFRSSLKHKKDSYYALFARLYYIQNNTAKEIIYDTHSIPTHFLFESYNDTILAINMSCICKIYNGKCIYYKRTDIHFNFATQLPDKTILIGGASGTGIFEFKNNSLVPYLNQFKELKTRINWIATDSVGNIWIATNEKGVFCYDKKQQHLRVFNETNGLASNKVNTCAVASNGDIWCGTHSGLIKLTVSQGLDRVKIENFDKNHGVVDMEIENITCFNNKVWCSGKTALFYFEQDKMTKNKQVPGVYLKSIHIKNQPFLVCDSLVLNYNQNDFRIQYELITYKKTDTRTFFYKLVGYDKNWSISNTGDIQYTNIGYGNYTLIVYGVNNDGLRNKIPYSINFIIKRPFWFTWWFILIIVILIMVLIYISAHYWRKRIEKKERDKAVINQKVAEFKMTALRSQMNPHFIFNAIGSIQHFILQNEAKQSYNYLAKFSMLIRNILNNSREEYISLEQEIITLKLYIELEQIRFTNPFEFIIDMDETIDMEIDIPTMLIQPYIENSIWHGLMPKSSGGILELILRKTDSTLHVIIRDNGVGRKMKTAHQHISKGMSITEQRIETLEATSQKKFNTRIVDLKDEQGNLIGTEVNLIIPFDN